MFIYKLGKQTTAAWNRRHIGKRGARALIDYAFQEVAHDLEDNQAVGWTPDEGYHAVDVDDITYSDYYW